MEVKTENFQATQYNSNNPGYGNSPGFSNNPAYGNNPTYPRPIEVGNETGCCRRNQQNKPQTNSAGSAVLIFASGGMNIAWSVGFTTAHYFPITTHMRICWFIAAIIGALIGAATCNYLQKKLTLIFSALLVILGGILFVAASTDPNAIIAARYIDGFANGLAFILTLVLVGEEAVKGIRGVLASTSESMCFALGIYIQILYSSLFDKSMDFNDTQIHGVISIIFGVVSLIFIFFFLIESPVFHLTRGEEQLAIESLRRLRRPCIVTTETIEHLEEHKRYIAINDGHSLSQDVISGLPALMKLCFYRAMLALSFSLMLTLTLTTSSLVSYGAYVTWPLVVYGTIRYLGVLFTGLFMDTAGRRIPTLLGALVCGGLAFGVGAIFNDPMNLFNTSTMRTALYLLLVFQLFAGIFIAASSTYLTEAFPLALKPFFIAIAFCVEMIVQIIIIASDKSYYGIAGYCFATGALMLVFFVLGILGLPETKRLSLREAQVKFRGFLISRN